MENLWFRFWCHEQVRSVQSHLQISNKRDLWIFLRPGGTILNSVRTSIWGKRNWKGVRLSIKTQWYQISSVPICPSGPVIIVKRVVLWLNLALYNIECHYDSLCMYRLYQIDPDKVKVFWEGHKYLMKSNIWLYFIVVI